ncbi:hypothetical protein GCM10007094_05440 [Pseudovibrio japonicus]|uniref:Uncharacterized protein n=2 Tax=Pseudovibrio japonicus TaxID=366534 RepID=A0ABQ3DZY0_9HYPH|nr:hypothetical protein GCM10007094_05440 [Pseudovibrio japonicus]
MVDTSDYLTAFDAITDGIGDVDQKNYQKKGRDDSYVLLKFSCGEVEETGEEHAFLFERSSTGKLIDAEYHFLLVGEFFPDKHEFNAGIFLSSKDAEKALASYLSDLPGRHPDEVILDLTQRGFFVHTDDINDEGQREVVFLKKPYPLKSLVARIGGNASPDAPTGLCLRFIDGDSSMPKILGTRDCTFDWMEYIQQAREILAGG